jgi:hypothetical protein
MVSESSSITTPPTVREKSAVVFHLIFTTDFDKFTTLNLRTIESIFFHHPEATVWIHWSAKYFRPGETQPPKPLEKLQEEGYDLHVKPYEVQQILKETLEHTDDSVVNKQLVESWVVSSI